MKHATFSIATILLMGGLLYLPAGAQGPSNNGYPALPKYPRNLIRFKKEYGTKPGSQVPKGGQDEASYRVIHYTAYGLRALVRAKCGTKVGDGKLRDMAEAYSVEEGPPVVLDYERIRSSDKVTFWAVACGRKTTSSYQLKNRNGRYMIETIQKQEDVSWKVQRVRKPSSGQSCFSEKHLDFPQLRKGILNVLTTATNRFFRSGQ